MPQIAKHCVGPGAAAADPIPKDVTIPRDIFISCPMIGFKLRQALQCDGCEHFRGLTQRMSRDDGTTLPFTAEFQGRCAYPVDRQLVAVEIEGA